MILNESHQFVWGCMISTVEMIIALCVFNTLSRNQLHILRMQKLDIAVSVVLGFTVFLKICLGCILDLILMVLDERREKGNKVYV